MKITDPRRLWADRLFAVARERLGDAEPSSESAHILDELGQHRPADAAFFAWRQARRGRCGLISTGHSAESSPDALLWRSLTDPTIDAISALQPGVDGPLLTWDRPPSIEVWTEAELAALHALWWVSIVRTDAALRDRCLAAAEWHVENLQPDNATNRPWAVHVFVELSIAEEHADVAGGAEVHAQTLLHNCQVGAGTGVVDLVSAHILMDAAEALLG